MKHRFSVRRTTVLCWWCAALLAGLVLARTNASLGVIILSMLSVLVVKRSLTINVLIIGMVVLLGAGYWRGTVFGARAGAYQQLGSQKAVWEVTAASDAVYGKNHLLGFDAHHIRVIEPWAADLPGSLRIEGFGEQAIYRGDKVRVVGSFYPRRGSRVGSVSYAQLQVLTRDTSLLQKIRKKFVAGMYTALPEPHASFALGLLIGQKTTLPDTVSTSLAAVGLTHIIAVSGYNLTIIVRGVRRLWGERSKYQMTLMSLLLIAGFLVITGFSASIVRAALVSILSLWAWYYGRALRPVLLILLVAALTALWNPLYMWRDVGWYLSFLAFFGILVLAPLVTRRLWGDKQLSPVKGILSETLAAQIMTAPLILYIFQEISPLSPISNVLVVPFVPLAMLLSFTAGLAGAVVPLLAGWVAVPGILLLTYMLDVSAWLAGLPYANIKGALSGNGITAVYIAIAGVCILLGRYHTTGVEGVDK